MGRKKIQISRITDERNRQVISINGFHFLLFLFFPLRKRHFVERKIVECIEDDVEEQVEVEELKEKETFIEKLIAPCNR